VDCVAAAGAWPIEMVDPDGPSAQRANATRRLPGDGRRITGNDRWAALSGRAFFSRPFPHHRCHRRALGSFQRGE
jgi:hypothetical protein